MGCCKFGDEIWYCFEPESLRLVTVIDNTDHMTMAACVSLHVPQVNSMEMNFSDEVLAHLICFRQTDGQSCCDVSYVPIMRSDAQSALFSSDCGEFEVYIREKIFEDCRVFLLERIEEMLSRGQTQFAHATQSSSKRTILCILKLVMRNYDSPSALLLGTDGRERNQSVNRNWRVQ